MNDISPIAPPWRDFLFRKLPIAVIAMALTAEILALGADKIAYRRHDLDLLALNVELAGPSQPQTIVVGDSVTQDIFKTYAIGAKDEVANLTTNQASGLVGSYLLLQRYLQNHTPPSHLLIAATPEFFTYLPRGETARVYVKTVFTKPDEITFLKTYLDDDEDSFAPAILHMDQRLGLKVQALLASSPAGLLMGSKEPDAHHTPQVSGLRAPLQDALVSRAKESLVIPDTNTAILRDICSLARNHHFTIHILTAPLPQTTHKAWMDRGVLPAFTAQLSSALQNDCPATLIKDGDSLVVPDAAMRDPDHLVRHDWTNVYALQLDSVVRGFVRQKDKP